MSINRFRCPTFNEVLAATFALLPRGRAWQTHEGGPRQGGPGAFSQQAFEPSAFSTEDRPVSVLWCYWASVASVFTFINERLCALRMEFWCATQSETTAEWMLEYGLPDLCDPFPDLCTKVAAIGGTRCEYYAAIASRAGWSITCMELPNRCGSQAGCAQAGDAWPGAPGVGHLVIVVDLSASPAFTGPRLRVSQAGCFQAGMPLSCGPDLGPLECLLSRVIHAEIQVKYEVTND